MSDAPGAGPSADPRHPGPFARVLDLLAAESDPYRRAWRTIDALEWAVKWETAIVLGSLLDRDRVPPDLRFRLAESLARPSLGIWMQYLHRGLEASDDPRLRDWDRALDLEARHGFVAFRNDYAHGAVERDDQALVRCRTFAPVVAELAATPFLTGTDLLVVADGTVRHLGGPRPGSDTGLEGRPAGTYARLGEAEDPVLLWPFAAHLPASGDRPAGVYFHNALRQHRVESLNYDLPARRRDPELLQPFHDRTPLDRWSHRDDGEPLEATALREDVLGRDGVVDDLVARVRGGAPEVLLLGPPGQGKSAVVATVAHRLRQPDDGPVVLDRYLRRGDHRSDPVHVLGELGTRIASLLGDRRPVEVGGTLARAAETLQNLLQRWHTSRAGGLVLVLDGLDEQPELLGALPRTAGRITLLWSARPTSEVDRTRRSRAVPGSAVVDLGALDEDAARAILYRGVDKLDPRLDRGYVRAVLERSAGNPLFLVTLSDHLFERPELVGDADVLPPDLADLLEQVVDRAVDRDDAATTLAVLRLLAVAMDRLEAGEMADLLDLDSHDVRQAVAALDELVATRRTAEGKAYALFHDSLRDWVQQRHPREVLLLHRRLATAAAMPCRAHAAAPYLLRHGIAHLEAVVAADRTPDAADARDLVAAAERHAVAHAAELADGLAPHEVVETMARIQDLTVRVDRPSDDLAPTLLALARTGDGPARITEGALHDVLTYRRRTALTDAVHARLEADWDADDPDRVRLAVLTAGRLRRLGSDNHRRRARRLLEPFRAGLAVAEAQASGTRARAWYELGYLSHLEDDPDTAVTALLRAAELGEGPGTATRRWSARCVATRIRWLGRRASSEEFLAVLAEADGAFRADVEVDPAAVRWRMNVVAHRFEVAVRDGDAEVAAPLVEQRESDPWLAAFGYLDTLQVDRDRLAILRGQGADVVAAVVARADLARAERPHSEAIADLDLDAARALRQAGDEDAATSYAERGAATPSGHAAWYVRPALREFLGDARADGSSRRSGATDGHPAADPHR